MSNLVLINNSPHLVSDKLVLGEEVSYDLLEGSKAQFLLELLVLFSGLLEQSRDFGGWNEIRGVVDLNQALPHLVGRQRMGQRNFEAPVESSEQIVADVVTNSLRF